MFVSNWKNNESHGATMSYLLAESQLSILTFVDERKVTIDIFTCNLRVEDKPIRHIMCDHFDVGFF